MLNSDVLPWQCHVRYPAVSENALFVDVDYPDLMKKKLLVVQETPQLQDLLGTGNVSFDNSGDTQIFLRSDKYCQIACDLRELSRLKELLEAVVLPSQTEFLFVAEVSVTYMDTSSADALIQWASSIGQCTFSSFL